MRAGGGDVKIFADIGEESTCLEKRADKRQ